MNAFIINQEKYPLASENSQALKQLCADARQAFQQHGALQLPDFIQPEIVTQLAHLATKTKTTGHRMQGMFCAYSDALNDADDPNLPADHPARLRLPASHTFIPGDLIPADNPLWQLYQDPMFRHFLEQVVGIPQLHPLAEAMGSINLLVYEPGDENGWHFDTNDFIISILLQEPESGGEYHYIPDLRSPDDDNLAAISWRMQNPDAPNGIHTVELKPGSLFLFKGKYTLHRVTKITGASDRIVAILSYHPSPGHRLSDSSKMAMYGRTEPITHHQCHAGTSS